MNYQWVSFHLQSKTRATKNKALKRSLRISKRSSQTVGNWEDYVIIDLDTNIEAISGRRKLYLKRFLRKKINHLYSFSIQNRIRSFFAVSHTKSGFCANLENALTKWNELLAGGGMRLRAIFYETLLHACRSAKNDFFPCLQFSLARNVKRSGER